MILFLWERDAGLHLASDDLFAVLNRIEPIKGRDEKGIGRVQCAGRSWVIRHYERSGFGMALDWMWRRHTRLVRAAECCTRFEGFVGSEAIYLLLNYGWIQLLPDLGDWPSLRQVYSGGDSAATERAVHRSIDLLGRAHRRSLVHGDAKWDNFVVASGGAVHAVDTQQVERVRFGALRAFGRDLGRFLVDAELLGVDEAQRDEWIRLYLKGSGVDARVVQAAEHWQQQYRPKPRD
ncbi:MAG: hypothetical protein ISN29_05725 [Gammaproteobacteria bacterium AqS3]|nr:hypothetical protein [Gammaproteobacteria bacterium AqS3]